MRMTDKPDIKKNLKEETYQYYVSIEYNKLRTISDITKKSLEKVRHFIKKVKGIKSKEFSGRIFYLPGLKETGEIIYVLKNIPEKDYRIFYVKGLTEGINFFTFYEDIERLRAESPIRNKKRFLELIKAFKTENINQKIYIHKEDVTQALTYLQDIAERKI